MALLPLKVDAADDDADDGRVGICKAPLPDGTAELKITKFEKFKKILRDIHPRNIATKKIWTFVSELQVLTDRQTVGLNIAQNHSSNP